jgi:AcrR family transcriptional regulator
MSAQRTTTKPAAVRAAAQRLFLSQGYVRTSMDAIAAEAGVTKQTVYRYYSTKSQLFSAVLGELAEGLQADLLGLVTLSPPAGSALEDTLSAAAVRILDHVLEPTYLSLVRTALAEAADFPELPERLQTEFVERGAAALAKVLQSPGVASLANRQELGAVQRLFAGSLLTFVLEGLLGDPVAARQRAQAQLPAIVHTLAAALVSTTVAGPEIPGR